MLMERQMMQNQPLRIAIVAGGDSSEHTISMKTARNIIEHIDRQRFNPTIVEIRKGEWHALFNDGSKVPVNRHDFTWSNNGVSHGFDAVFNAIHGTPGENGILLSYFELINLPVTGCKSFCSSLTFNKYVCNQFLRQAGIRVADSVRLFRNQATDPDGILAKVGLPCVVKPNNGGSSCGSSKVKEASELMKAIDLAFAEDDEVIIEQFLEGPEVTCGLLQYQSQKIIFPLTAVISKNEFFDYEAKYTPGLAEEITPAPVPDEVARSVSDLSAQIYDLLGCRGVVRMDYILVNNLPFFLEVNTVPGLTRESIVPRQVTANGMNLTTLISMLLDEALEN